MVWCRLAGIFCFGYENQKKLYYRATRADGKALNSRYRTLGNQP
jgi:hypothetical protein